MKTLKIWLLLSAVLFQHWAIAAEKSNFTLIKGKFDFEVNAKVELKYVYQGEEQVFATTDIGANGDFGFHVPIDAPGFYYLDYGQRVSRKGGQLIRFYLEPGLNFDIQVSKESYRLQGKKIGHNLIVQQANELYFKMNKYNQLGGSATYKDFFPYLEKEAVSATEKFIASVKTKDERFNKLIKLAAQIDLEQQAYTFFRLPRSAHPEKDNRPQVFKEWKKEVKFSDPDLLLLGNGYAMMENYFFYQMMQEGFKTPRVKMIEEAISHISDLQLKEVYIRNQIVKGRFKVEEYETMIDPLYQYLTSEQSKSFLAEYEKELHKNVGQPGFNFSYENPEGKKVAFSDFKGKLVYIDVWATWCGPCRKEIPHLKKLEEELKGEDIVFVSISLDELKDKQKWSKFIKDKEMGGVQLFADKAFKSGIAVNYEINAIPRFLLFDKKGNIISTDALRPSNPELKKQLEGLLKK
ncbi:TlpA disulfide reductase family protein [Rapidithrix thailandica]|uniref:TlpA disulfide reductase family protein n=1 Tax=Rapidithrix thailandica TaxID=413964 RepID=A0AAW9S9T7_9BACT